MTPKRVYFFLILLFFTFHLQAQYYKTASCADPDFDKKVNENLSYTVPVIGVVNARKDKSSYIFLDAREFEEYNISHIAEARFIGYDHFKLKNVADIPKEKKIIVYCSIGYRSEKIATKLKENGFLNVYNLYGSIFEWANAGFELFDKRGKPTNKIHTYNESWSKWVINPGIEKIR